MVELDYVRNKIGSWIDLGYEKRKAINAVCDAYMLGLKGEGGIDAKYFTREAREIEGIRLLLLERE